VTFDSYGVSGHPNHQDVHHGIWLVHLSGFALYEQPQHHKLTAEIVNISILIWLASELLFLTVHYLFSFHLLMDFWSTNMPVTFMLYVYSCCSIVWKGSISVWNSKFLHANRQGNIEAWELVSFFPKILGSPSLGLLIKVISVLLKFPAALSLVLSWVCHVCSCFFFSLEATH
jgi:hypothetical protein